MTSSLVGSEMCIRDRPNLRPVQRWGCAPRWSTRCQHIGSADHLQEKFPPVSYTHLTLPTICSV
eukprot:5295769-Prorocentrum_lima.AAC.1